MEEIEEKLDLFLTHLKESEKMQELKEKKELLLQDSEFLLQIRTFQAMDKWDPAYLAKKQEILAHPIYKRYLALEEELMFLTMALSSRLKKLVKEVHHANH